jgi:hypothetical protein
MFYGVSGLLLVLGIVVLFLGNTLLGAICLLLALASVGMARRRGRTA